MSETIKEVILAIVRKRIAEQCDGKEPFPLYLENPKEKKYGDWSISAAMKLSKLWKKAPRDIAVALADDLKEQLRQRGFADSVDKIEVVPPGFAEMARLRTRRRAPDLGGRHRAGIH